MKPLRLALVVALIAAGFAGGVGYARWSAARAVASAPVEAPRPRYHCPMHPEYVSDTPGTCPICGMALVPIEGERPAPTGQAPHGGAVAAPSDASSLPPGTIRVSLEKQQLIGVTYGTVESTSTSRTLRAVGSVAIDETRITKVHTRVDGWIEKVHVDFTGKPVREGQPLLTIYSPELLATQQEFLLAIRQQEQMRSNPVAGIARDSDALVDSARRRLQLWNLTDAQIDQVASTRTPIPNVPVLSPATGYVLARNAYPGQRVTPETELYALADLTRVWIVADVFEADAGSIRPGMTARIALPYGERRLTGRVSFIVPQLDPASRTLKVRIETDNPGQALKPDMFVNVEFDLASERHLTVPADAVLDSGTHQVVFVDLGDGYLEPRRVQIGDRLSGRVVIREGLKEGERIVTSGTFLIDSESQLKAATAGGAEHRHD